MGKGSVDGACPGLCLPQKTQLSAASPQHLLHGRISAFIFTLPRSFNTFFYPANILISLPALSAIFISITGAVTAKQQHTILRFTGLDWL